MMVWCCLAVVLPFAIAVERCRLRQLRIAAHRMALADLRRDAGVLAHRLIVDWAEAPFQVADDKV